MDRLPDDFHTEEENTAHYKEIIEPSKPNWNAEPTQQMVAMYSLNKDGVFTGKVLLVTTDDQVDMLGIL